MTANTRTTAIILAIVGSLVVAIAYLAHAYYRAWYGFASEEQICEAFHPVLDGIARFQESAGMAPTNLTQLVPSHIPELPTAPIADSIDYRVMADGTNWQLTVHSRITGDSRVYVQRSSHEFKDEERRRMVASFHGWVVLSE